MKAWGIDYGTTTSLWIEYNLGEFVDKCYPIWSSIYSANDNRLYFGNDAYCNQNRKGQYVRSPKRFLDNDYPEQWPLSIEVDQAIAKFFEHMFVRSQGVIGNDSVPYITLTVPNSFKEKQYMRMRRALVDAAKNTITGFDDERFDIIPEPIAAALYYAHKQMCDGTLPDNCHIIVCDIGGGTTDVAIVHCAKLQKHDGQLELSFNVLCTSPYGNGLGGDVFDDSLVKYLTKSPNSALKTTPRHILNYLAKTLKGYLSDVTCATIPLVDEQWNVVCDNVHRPIKLCCTRDNFIKVISSSLRELKGILKSVSEEYYKSGHSKDLAKNNGQLILLPVGGSCRIPEIKQMLIECFSNAKMVESNNDFITYNSVACGAAIYSAWRLCQSENDRVLPYSTLSITNRTPHKYTIENGGGLFYETVPRNAPDGIYSAEFIPIKLNEDGTFRIGKVKIYQGESQMRMHADGQVLIFEQNINEELYTHGRSKDAIKIFVYLEIKSSRLNSIKLVAKESTQDSQDYVKLIDINQL